MANFVSRRGFLHHSAAGVAGTGLAGWLAPHVGATTNPAPRARSVITLHLVGAPAALDTFDPKPQAPAEVRGPFKAIATATSGMSICEHLPRLAGLSQRYALVRSLHHDSYPLHETGLHWLNTGSEFLPGQPRPYLGSVVASLTNSAAPLPAAILLPGPIRDTGGGTHFGQTAASLGAALDPVAVDPAQVDSEQLARWPELRRAVSLRDEPAWLREAYGRHDLGRWLLTARRLVERGVRHVAINQFTDLFDGLSWDMHANGGRLNTTFDDYRQTLLPQLDQAVSALLHDLQATGLLGQTLVCVVAEMGRTPRINRYGGRDHHAQAWTHLVAGAGVVGGQVIGATDAHGGAVVDAPVSPSDWAATVYQALGIDPAPYSAGEPIAGLF